jgi:hypothetical protein
MLVTLLTLLISTLGSSGDWLCPLHLAWWLSCCKLQALTWFSGDRADSSKQTTETIPYSEKMDESGLTLSQTLDA